MSNLSQLLTVVIILLCIRIQHICTSPSQKSHLNYVKPYKNITCPSDPCLTLDEYRNATDEYFISGTEFIFIPGRYIFNGRLKLVNISNMYFHAQRGEKQKVWISFNFSSNLTFTTCNNITLSHLTFIIGGIQTIPLNGGYVTLLFQFTYDVKLFNLTFFGDGSTYGQSAMKYYFSSGWIRNIQTVEVIGYLGAALTIINSTVKLVGDNTFANNTAVTRSGGTIYASGGVISFSGRNIFENNVFVSGGAVAVWEATLKFRGTALFRHNSAVLSGGAITISGTKKVSISDVNLFFIENYIKSTKYSMSRGAAMYIREADVYITGNLMVQGCIARQGGGIKAEYSNVTIVGNIVFINNSGWIGGGVNAFSSQVFLSSAIFTKNTAFLGGGAISMTNSSVTIEDSVFTENGGNGFGTVIYAAFNSLCVFRGNNHIRDNYGALYGVGVFRSTLYFSGTNYFTNNTAFYGTVFMSISHASIYGTLKFINNQGRTYAGAMLVGLHNTIEFDTYANVSFEGNIGVYGGAIHSTYNTWNIRGNLTFYNNSASIGGAMLLTGYTKLVLNENTKIIFVANHAEVNGGAIYYEDFEIHSLCHMLNQSNILSYDICFEPNSTYTRPCRYLIDCFIEFNADIPFNASTSNISILFQHNSATKTGTAIFGGSLDNCRLYLGGGFQDKCGNKIGRAYSENSLEILLKMFSIDNMTSAITSEPYRVCFCYNGLPDCERNETVSTIRGKQFTLTAVTVGQGNFTVPSSIKADFNNVSTGVQLSILQRVQNTGHACTNIFYRIFTADNFVTLVLFPDGPCRDSGISRREVIVSFHPCPNGFIHIGSECVCDQRLSDFNVSCDVDRESFLRTKNNFWMMPLYDNLSYQGLILHQAGCPFDYCKESPIEVMLNNSDIQCNYNHSGVICGACQGELSLALGSLHCLPCSNAYLCLILLFILAGIALVAILLLLRLTVALGTMNGLIFYANIVQMNRNIFFPPSQTNVLTVFIAWLNLDLGIETCFYDGMDTYAFMWLQFMFPFYIWFLIGFTIFLSRHSITVTRALGNNPVSVLATLLLVSYSKILRIIISALSHTSLQYPDGSHQYVWLYDGNVPYFQRADHIMLAIFAVLILILLFLPYTLLLLCGHWLQAYSRGWLLSCFNRMMPFLDTYYAPFKKSSRYWTGFLLLIRCLLFLTFTFNALGSASINLLAITSISVAITVFAWLQNRLYIKIYNDILEASFFLNLCLLSAVTYHMKETGEQQDKIAYTSAGVAFLTFIGIVSYHIFLVTQKIRLSLWKRLFRDHGGNKHHGSVVNNDISTVVPTTTIELRDPLLG